MSLLLQVVPAQYAFVVHTANPISKQKGETFGEVVMGMGEALVGNYPGRALSFSSAPGQKARPACTAVCTACPACESVVYMMLCEIASVMLMAGVLCWQANACGGWQSNCCFTALDRRGTRSCV